MAEENQEPINWVTETEERTDVQPTDVLLLGVPSTGKSLHIPISEISASIQKGQPLNKNTMEEMRALTDAEIDGLVRGIYSHVQLNGYYSVGDTPAAINYYLSDTDDPDDGGSVIEVGDIKLEHEFIGLVDVRYFGAIPDGISPSTLQIQNAINLSTVSTVDLSKSSYAIDERLTVTTGKTIQNGIINLIAPTGAENRYKTVWVTGDNITLSNLTINGGTVEKLGAIRLHLSNMVIIKDVNILGNNPGWGVFCNTKSDNVFLENVYCPQFRCAFQYNDAVSEQNPDFRTVDGVTYTGTIGSGVTVTNCLFGDTNKTIPGDGMLINTPDNGFSNVRINNLTINKILRLNPEWPSGLAIAFAGCNNVVVDSCSVSNTDWRAVHIEKSADCKVKNCSFKSTDGINVESSKDVVVENNGFYDCRDGFSSVYSNSDYTCTDVIFKNNFLFNITRFAVVLANCSRFALEGNTFSNYNGSTSQAIINFQTLSGIGVTDSKVINNSFIKGSGSNISVLFSRSTESINNVWLDNLFSGYGLALSPQGGASANMRINTDISNGRKKGNVIYSDKDPNGYFTGRAGDLAIDTLTGYIYRCAGGTTYTRILPMASGNTAGRPTVVFQGLAYFDTTLGKPIWRNGSNWVDATGATV